MALDLNKPTFTETSETFRPQKIKDHPVTHQEWVKGGHQNFTSIAQRDAFSLKKRAAFMTCTVRGVSYILEENLQIWNPFDRGYLVLNPKRANEAFYVAFPFRFAVLSITALDATVLQPLINGLPNIKQTVILSGSEGSVVTFEIARIHVD